MTPPPISRGLSEVLQLYCQYRGWESASVESVKGIRELINRAGTIDETKDGLYWFFKSKYCDDYIKRERPNLPINFLIECWSRFQIADAEYKKPEWNPWKIPNEYQILRAVK